VDTQINRFIFLRVPLDIVTPEELPDVINRMLFPDKRADTVLENRGRNIILLSLWDFLKARRDNEYREYVLRADLVIPISKSLVNGAVFLTGKKPVRYMPYNFIVDLLTILERQEYPLYLIGGRKSVLKRAERNIRLTFPRLKIIGRCPGGINKQEEPMVIEAIRKSSPSLLLAGKGIRGGELWLARNRMHLNSGFRIWCSNLFDIFADKSRRPSDFVFDHGLENIGFFFRNPLLFYRFFLYLYYKLLLVFTRFSGK